MNSQKAEILYNLQMAIERIKDSVDRHGNAAKDEKIELEMAAKFIDAASSQIDSLTGRYDNDEEFTYDNHDE